MVQEVVAAGYGAVSPGEIAKMSDHGLSGPALRKAQALGRKLNVDEIIRLRDSGAL
jgi:hypothetical protein